MRLHRIQLCLCNYINFPRSVVLDHDWRAMVRNLSRGDCAELYTWAPLYRIPLRLCRPCGAGTGVGSRSGVGNEVVARNA